MAENVAVGTFPLCENGSRKLIDFKTTGNGSNERMAKECIKDGKHYCYPGWTWCAPGLGGGCCPPHHPVCCGNGYHCRKHGPC